MTTTTPIALITGANRGLGRATALALAAEGADAIITFRSNEAEAADVVTAVEALGRRAVALPLDTTATGTFAAFADAVREALRAWDRDTLDVLVNNAGSAANAPFAETTEEQFDLMFAVHVKGPFFLTQTLLPLIADGGSIVNLSTGLTRFANPGMAAYGAAKGAVEILTRYQALELGARGIAVNAVAPGPTGTDFGGGYLRDDEELRARLSSLTAMGRVGVPEDIGAAIAGLVLHSGRWTTGQRIEVSGGTRL
jgi:NAD(P)-dependent dehydrogenase (short-subunit alcohol dehydrogenase family)